MSKVIIFTNENGNVSVCVPTGELPIEAVLVKDCPSHAIIVDASELPEQDNDFFNSWELIDGVMSVNLDKAKAQTKDRLRVERAPLLAAQDVAFQRALKEGKVTTAIGALEQRLRDITGLADSCKSTEELRGVKP